MPAHILAAKAPKTAQHWIVKIRESEFVARNSRPQNSHKLKCRKPCGGSNGDINNRALCNKKNRASTKTPT